MNKQVESVLTQSAAIVLGVVTIKVGESFINWTVNLFRNRKEKRAQQSTQTNKNTASQAAS